MDKKTINAIIMLTVAVVIIGAIFWSADLSAPNPQSKERESVFSFSVDNKAVNSFNKDNNTAKESDNHKAQTEEIPKLEERAIQSVKDTITSIANPSKNKTDNQSQEAEPAPTQTLSEDEVFNKLWPDYYRSHLSEIQDYLIDQNPTTTKYNFNSEANIFNFLNEYLVIYKDMANLSTQEFNDLQNKINNSQNIKQDQKQEIIGDIGFSKLFANLIKTTHAGYVTGAFWYKDDAPGNPSPGIASPNTCGNCGIDIRTGTNRFIFNCQAYGALCDIHLGCLNGTCRAFPNAIWDPTTIMCGCG